MQLNRFPITLLAGFITGLVSLFIPLLRNFHWESASVAAVILSFYCLYRASKRKHGYFHIFKSAFYLYFGWGLPLLISDIAHGCYSFDGLAFWVTVPLPAALFGLTAGRLSAIMNFKMPLLPALSFWFFFLLIPTLYEFLNYPQLFFYNQIWGYWPGPIYDETVIFPENLLLFRISTFVWIAILWTIPAITINKTAKAIILPGTLFLVLFYLNVSGAGFISDEKSIANKLGGIHSTQHFRIIYDPLSADSDSIKKIGKLHEAYLDEITAILKVDSQIYKSDPILSFIYPGTGRKKQLTGAGNTNYVPVWLNQDQMHITLKDLDGVLKHEMVHVVARQFGNWFGASYSIGLVEGLAVAIGPKRFRDVSIDQVVAAGDTLPGPLDLEKLFGFTGFYQQPGIISYTVTGSFVRHMLRELPPEKLKEAYRKGSIDNILKSNGSKIVETWHQYLESIPVDSAAIEMSETIYATKSIFKKKCPRLPVSGS